MQRVIGPQQSARRRARLGRIPHRPQYRGWHSSSAASSEPCHRAAAHGSSRLERQLKSLRHGGPPFPAEGHGCLWRQARFLSAGPAAPVRHASSRARWGLPVPASPFRCWSASGLSRCPPAVFICGGVRQLILAPARPWHPGGGRSFADDTSALLANLDSVSAFLTAMDVLGRLLDSA